jgi:hypothetical protein
VIITKKETFGRRYIQLALFKQKKKNNIYKMAFRQEIKAYATPEEVNETKSCYFIL